MAILTAKPVARELASYVSENVRARNADMRSGVNMMQYSMARTIVKDRAPSEGGYAAPVQLRALIPKGEIRSHVWTVIYTNQT
jgi:hypothetical protein